MQVTVSISNKSFWVQTWKMMGDLARRSETSASKTAKTNPDGTVTADIDLDIIPELIAAIEKHNKQYVGMNELRVVVSADAQENRTRAAR